MTPDEFKTAMRTFKALYLRWEFDTENPIMLSAWYQMFRNLTSNEFMQLCVNYTKNNDYPPNSPRQLRLAINDDIVKGYPNTMDALSIIVDYANKYHPAYGTGLQRMKTALEADKPYIANAFDKVQGLFVGCQDPWNNAKLLEKFSDAYMNAVKEDSTTKIDDYYSEKDETRRKALLSNGNTRLLR